MDNKSYAALAHEANLQGKILVVDGDSYSFEDMPSVDNDVILVEAPSTLEIRMINIEQRVTDIEEALVTLIKYVFEVEDPTPIEEEPIPNIIFS